MKDGYQEHEFFNLSGVRYLIVTISNITKPIEINSILIKSSYYPVKEEGAFTCSDSLVNEIYEAGKYTLKMCRQDYHMDSPIHQEALDGTGDYLIDSLVNYYTYYDPRLTRLDIWRTAQMLNFHNGLFFHTSYSLLFVQMVWDYYMFTGDASILNEVEGTLDILVNRFRGYIGESGVIDKAPNYMFMDWVPLGQHNLHHPPRTIGQGYLTAMFIRALENCEKIYGVLCREAKAAESNHQSNRMKEAFNQVFWNESKGLYCDGVNNTTPTVPNDWLPADIEGIYFSQHTNSLAVLYDIAPESRKTEMMEKVLNDATLTQAQPYFMHFVMEAIYEAGLFEKYGLQQIRRWEKLLDECRSSLKEVWSGFDCDYSHAWGGTPTYQLPSKVLGIKPLKPGYAEVEINPVLGSLEFAKGEVMTPHGKIKVEFTNNGQYYKADIEIPEKIKVKFGQMTEFSKVNITKI
jgi:alpha-L-rhamnosidase